ncbi:hypothetical protein SISNIDRAFT_468371 [Sistotremastrum niveocremeum HHB9708]|uniref:WD40 repeat-like protein n=1 Tax=Sistotremastrum niveocremeum HHB9708 TaxID=1314777 RepID=A0A164RIN9_9AGAM|nr:hypothetical protein SISNIDRAFT_468371 [Sistotremastrum niveocremeum HHB9708]
MPYSCVKSIRYNGVPIRCLSISPCGNLLACGADDGLRVWDDFDADPIVVLLEFPVSEILWISSQLEDWKLVCGLENGSFVALEYHSGKYRSQGRFMGRDSNARSCPRVAALRFCGDARFLLTAFADGSLLCFSLKNRTVTWATNLDSTIMRAIISPSAESIVLLAPGAVVSYTLKDMHLGCDVAKYRRSVSLQQRAIASPVSFVDERDVLFTEGASGDVCVWDMKRGSLIDQIHHDGGKLLAIDTRFGTRAEFEVATARATISPPEASSVRSEKVSMSEVSSTTEAILVDEIRHDSRPNLASYSLLLFSRKIAKK